MYYIGAIPAYPSDELTHHGIKGMKWGVRRWQNEDGTFNEAGKKRYTKVTRGQGEFRDRIDVNFSRAGRKAVRKDKDYSELVKATHNKIVADSNFGGKYKGPESESAYNKALSKDKDYSNSVRKQKEIAEKLVNKYLDRHGKEMVNTQGYYNLIRMAEKDVDKIMGIKR